MTETIWIKNAAWVVAWDAAAGGHAYLRDGDVVGRVIRVDHFPAQDLLVVRVPGGGEVLVPFVAAITGWNTERWTSFGQSRS